MVDRYADGKGYIAVNIVDIISELNAETLWGSLRTLTTFCENIETPLDTLIKVDIMLKRLQPEIKDNPKFEYSQREHFNKLALALYSNPVFLTNLAIDNGIDPQLPVDWISNIITPPLIEEN